MTADCTWDEPGRDRYAGTIPAAIAAYGLPIATQSELIRAWESREFADHVVIDRTDIRGQTHDYAPTIRSMHFGGRGRVCESVSRAGWSLEHVETAIVLCADNECIAIPSVCTNVFRLTRIARAPARPADDGRDDVVVALDAPLSGPIADPQTPSAATLDPAGSAGWSASRFGWAGGAYAPSYALAPTQVPTAPIEAPAAPVPELPTWGLMALGLACIAWRRA